MVKQEPQPHAPFVGTRFPAWLSPTGLKITRLGDAEIKLVVPYKFRDSVMTLMLNETLLLDVDIDAWTRDAPKTDETAATADGT